MHNRNPPLPELRPTATQQALWQRLGEILLPPPYANHKERIDSQDEPAKQDISGQAYELDCYNGLEYASPSPL